MVIFAKMNGDCCLEVAFINDDIEEFIGAILRYQGNETTFNELNEDVEGTLLHLAADDKADKIMKYILENYKVDVNAVDTIGYTPLHISASLNSVECVRLLLEYGADTEIQTFEERKTPLDLTKNKNIREMLSNTSSFSVKGALYDE